MLPNTKLTQLLSVQSGILKNREWKKQDIIGETKGNYPKKGCISIWGNKINEGLLHIGKLLKIDFDIESRDYNCKWLADINVNTNVFLPIVEVGIIAF